MRPGSFVFYLKCHICHTFLAAHNYLLYQKCNKNKVFVMTCVWWYLSLLFTLIYGVMCRGWYRRVYAFCVQGIISKMALRWRRGDVTVPNCWIKSLFLFYFHTKSILVAHNSQIEPLMADGVSWRRISYFYGPWQCNLLGSQWDSHKPPGFHPKYLKLCSEDERSFYGFGTTWW